MDSHYPLSAKRLYALMGDRMIDFPPYFIERLERRLEAFETSRTNEHRVMHLRVVPEPAAVTPKEGSGCHVDPVLSGPDGGFANARVSNLRGAEMAEYLDARLNMANYDETTFVRSLLLVSELHGMSHIARECGHSSEVMRRQLSGNRPL